jgi:hypothetical protein
MAEKATIHVYKIDKNIPLPEPEVGSVPLNDMEVGDSVQFPIEERSRVLTNAGSLKRRKGKVFTVKTLDENNCRVWRIE